MRDGDYFFWLPSTITPKSNSCYLCLIESRQTIPKITFGHRARVRTHTHTHTIEEKGRVVGATQ